MRKFTRVWIGPILTQSNQLFVAVAVAQLVERSLPRPEIRGSNPDIGEILSTTCSIEKTKRKRKRAREWPIFKKIKSISSPQQVIVFDRSDPGLQPGVQRQDIGLMNNFWPRQKKNWAIEKPRTMTFQVFIIFEKLLFFKFWWKTDLNCLVRTLPDIQQWTMRGRFNETCKFWYYKLVKVSPSVKS